MCIARLCSEFSKVKCFSISFGGEKCTDYKVCVSVSPKVCQSGGAEASHNFSVTPVSVLAACVLSTRLLGVSRDTLVCPPGRSMKEALTSLPSPGFPRYLLEQGHPSENWTFAPKMLFLKTPKEGACLC